MVALKTTPPPIGGRTECDSGLEFTGSAAGFGGFIYTCINPAQSSFPNRVISMKSLLVLLSAMVALLSGCATPLPVQPPELQFTDHPALNVESTAEIGETLLAKGKVYVFEGLDLQERISDLGTSREYIVEPHAMRLERIDGDGKRYYVPALDSYFVNDKAFNRRARPSGAFLVLKSDGALELQGYYDLTTAGKISPTTPRFKIGKIVDRRQPNFRQELIYGGRVGNQIKLTYREFSGDLIRPGFTQEAQYDIATDTTVGFKGVRITVIDATNTRLKYKVLKSFADAN